MKKDIAIIGTGISGLTCAHLLHEKHNITVYEANDYIGGHTATKDVTVHGQPYAIDTGFIVFNDWTYPNFIKLINQLGVDYQPTEMSFSVRHEGSNIEYNGHNLNTLFAQRRNLLRPRFWQIVRDIVRFNNLCKETLEQEQDTSGQTLSSFIAQHGFSDDFSEHYIYPMCAAIWSASLEQTKAFPLTFFLQFFNNHGLLNVSDRPQWYTIKGGSREYIAPLVKPFADRVRLSSPISRVEHTGGGIAVTTAVGQTDYFDEVIFACHSDQALAMLAHPTEEHQRILGKIGYAENDVVLHYDTRQLPRRKAAWASWNYRLTGDPHEQERPTAVTYDMNILQRLQAPETFCVSLNTPDIDGQKILGTYSYAHPQFSEDMVRAQQQRAEICGKDSLHFCGAYWYNGFHEDGVRSALDVCERFGARL
ncbi:NAD(P)/FAD-dependent oxidoreductase [Alteromonas lipolytica]|uniref:FAD-dependent oxidoreductase n=1 Tax=Alteromonas lipolytica TaxID=1856405 RepID=A0A1E8F992_9ALTE|nr:FAD-dependent oxidoreductase [Alteromonas lipolytica]OFI32485.1 FAD-dependent oxidoreductase [Alteromonas lipolytica]GGF75783.1 amine oxidase [Alteromonas lipolytica]